MYETSGRSDEALRIVKANSGWSAVAGLAPFPLLDLAAITAVQVRMLKKLSDHYGVPFRKDLAKSVIGAIISGSSAFLVATPVASMLKIVPGIGTFASTFVTPAAAAATTYALGKVFIQHFESGGTLLDMNPDRMRAHFYEEYKRRETSPESYARRETSASAQHESPATS